MSAVLAVPPAPERDVDAEMAAATRRLLGRKDIPDYFAKIAPVWLEAQHA